MLRYKPCNKCGCTEFTTAKTEIYDVTVSVKTGNMVDSENVYSSYQPDTPYGIFVCQKCGKNHNELEFEKG